MKVYLIYQTFKWYDETKFGNPSVIYGVANEKQARKDCIRLQVKSSNETNSLYKTIYFYEEIEIFP